MTSFEHNRWYVLELDNNPIIFADISHGPSQYTWALSLLYLYENQQEIDSFYQGGSAEVESEQCGWIVDKYGISWQIVPRMFLNFATKLSPATYQKILTMKKIEIAQIEKLI
ncbi:VOC family protein [Enterococcus cecorum]|uniref:VOC family protein n=1 Tax=Enterococcus cecorum TaxID=44008 RepID=UPI0032C409BD